MVGAHAQDRHLHCRRAPPPPPHQLTPIHHCVQNSSLRAHDRHAHHAHRSTAQTAKMIYARSAISFLVLLSSADAQQVGTLKTEKHPQLTVQRCTKTNGCATEQKKVVVDSNWRWTHKVGEAKDCYHGNSWDPTLCPDAATCAKNCALEGADEEYENTYGIRASGAELKLGFVTQARRNASAQFSSAQFSGARAQLSLSSRSLSSPAGCLLEEHRLAHVPARRRRDVQALQAEERRILLRRRRLEVAVRPQRRAPLQHARGLFPP